MLPNFQPIYQCELATITMIGMSVVSAASTAVSVRAQNKQADAQNRAIEESNQRNYESSIIANMGQQQESIQEQESLSTESFSRDRARGRQMGELIARGAESGTSGLSLARSLDNVSINKAIDQSAIDSQSRTLSLNKQLEANAGNQRYRNQIDRRNFKGVSNLEAGLSIASSGVSGAASGFKFGKGLEEYYKKK